MVTGGNRRPDGGPERQTILGGLANTSADTGGQAAERTASDQAGYQAGYGDLFIWMADENIWLVDKV